MKIATAFMVLVAYTFLGLCQANFRTSLQVVAFADGSVDAVNADDLAKEFATELELSLNAPNERRLTTKTRRLDDLKFEIKLNGETIVTKNVTDDCLELVSATDILVNGEDFYKDKKCYRETIEFVLVASQKENGETTVGCIQDPSVCIDAIDPAFTDEVKKAAIEATKQKFAENFQSIEVKMSPVFIITDGDPHFLTWNQEWYDYMGICDLVMVDAPAFNNGQGLLVQIRTKARYEYSFIESAAIKIGSDVLEIGAHGAYLLNGVSNSDLTTVGGFPITLTKKTRSVSVLTIDMGAHGKVYLKAFKDLVGVKFDGFHSSDFGDSVGMMGSYENGAHVARDGKTVIEDVNEFGQEWQVLPSEPMLFQTPPTEGECVLPTPATDSSRRLGESISEEAAEIACAKSTAFEQCIYDVIATGDLEAATAGAF